MKRNTQAAKRMLTCFFFIQAAQASYVLGFFFQNDVQHQRNDCSCGDTG